MKKHKATLMSLGKPKSPKAIAHEVTEPASKETAAISPKGTNSSLKSSATEGPQKEPENRKNLGVQVQESCIDIAKRINAAGISHCPINDEKETETLGPYEWLDSEIKRLEYALQRQVADPFGNNTVVTLETDNEAPSMSKESENYNGVMGPKRVAVHYLKKQSNSSNGCSSNEESNGEWYNSFSPMNPRFDEEWLDWDWTIAGDLGGWGLL
jgi:myb proto-oncogene protein